jgi:hypothetical protein
MVASVVAGFLVADILSGVAHWLQDKYLPYCVSGPDFWKAYARNIEMHHYYPRLMLRRPVYTVTIVPLIVTSLFYAILYAAFGPTMFSRYPLFFASLFFFSVVSTVPHWYAHCRECEKPSLVSMLQACGILLSSEQHKEHHDHVHVSYCMLSSYCNPILNHLRVWPRMERAIHRLSGVEPLHNMAYRDYVLRDPLHVHTETDPCPRKPDAIDYDNLHTKLRLMQPKCPDAKKSVSRKV